MMVALQHAAETRQLVRVAAHSAQHVVTPSALPYCVMSNDRLLPHLPNRHVCTILFVQSKTVYLKATYDL